MATAKKPLELRSRRAGKPTVQPPAVDTAVPQQAHDLLPLQVILQLIVDGEPKHNLIFNAQTTRPGPGQGVGAVFPVDARKLAALLEPLIGPARRVWIPKD